MHESYDFLTSALEEAAGHYKIPDLTISFDGSTPIIQGGDSVVEARLFGYALKILSQARQNLGQSMLIALWHIYVNGFVSLMEEEFDPKDFVDWVKLTLDPFEDEKYGASLSYVVARILQDVYKHQMDGTPYCDDQGPITVERLLNTPGLVKRLVTASGVWESAQVEQRKELLNETLNATSHTKVRDKADIVRDGDVSMRAVIPYRVITSGGKTTIVFENLEADQLDRLQALIQGACEATYAVGSASNEGGTFLW